MFLCQLNTRPVEDLNDFENYFKAMFGTDKNEALDVTKSSVRFLLAAKAGKVAGFEQCLALYPRCDMSYDEMLTIMNPEENVINDKADENQN